MPSDCCIEQFGSGTFLPSQKAPSVNAVRRGPTCFFGFAIASKFVSRSMNDCYLHSNHVRKKKCWGRDMKVRWEGECRKEEKTVWLSKWTSGE